MTTMLGWHFTDGTKLRDGQPLAVRTYEVTGPLKLCSRGLHASERAIDALKYAPGTTVSRVELSGNILRDTDKACATRRGVLWHANAGRILREFAIVVATDALELVAARGCRVDPRSRSALRVAAAYFQGAATRDALSAAQREAWAARSDLRAAAYAAAAAAAADAAADDDDAYAAYAAAAAAAAYAYAAYAASRRERYDAMNEALTTMLFSLEPQ